MSIPIWVTDPAGNDNPFLKITGPALFVLYVSDAGVWYSKDGINFTKASTAVDNLMSLGNVPITTVTSPVYLNGLWCFSYLYDTGQAPFGPEVYADAIIYSYDGMNWNTGFIPTNAQINNGQIFMDALLPGFGANPANTNRILLDNTVHVSPPKIIQIPLPCKFPSNNPHNIQVGDDDKFSSNDILVDPAQGGGALTFSGSNGFYAQNSLPAGINAMRFTAPGGTSVMVESTNTPITQGIVNGSSNMSGATWTTRFNRSSLGGNYFYGFPSA